MGAKIDGYCADMTRTFIMGPADEHFRKIYSLVRRAQARAEAGLKAGMDSLAGDALAREVIAAGGLWRGLRPLPGAWGGAGGA